MQRRLHRDGPARRAAGSRVAASVIGVERQAGDRHAVCQPVMEQSTINGPGACDVPVAARPRTPCARHSRRLRHHGGRKRLLVCGTIPLTCFAGRRESREAAAETCRCRAYTRRRCHNDPRAFAFSPSLPLSWDPTWPCCPTTMQRHRGSRCSSSRSRRVVPMGRFALAHRNQCPPPRGHHGSLDPSLPCPPLVLFPAVSWMSRCATKCSRC